MLWHLVAAIFAGLAAAGIGLLLRTVSGKRLPRWIVPVFAGLGMLAYQIHHEYSWFSYKQLQLPESSRVVAIEKGEAFWRPWTYFYPMTIAFEVVDRDNLARTRAADEPLVEFILYRFEKLHMDRVTTQAYLMNCRTREMLPLSGEEGRPRFSELRRLEASDPLLEAVCEDP